MFKSLNDLSTPDFSELFQLNESLHGLRSNCFYVIHISFLLSFFVVFGVVGQLFVAVPNSYDIFVFFYYFTEVK